MNQKEQIPGRVSTKGNTRKHITDKTLTIKGPEKTGERKERQRL